MRASGLKRELSYNSLNGGPPEKKCARKVSFGSLETVVFNKNHNSSNLTGGVSVSTPHFGTTPNARWGNGESSSANADNTWGTSNSSSSSSNFGGSAGNHSRWGQTPPEVIPQTSKFLSSQMENAVNVIMHQAASVDSTRHAATQPLQRQFSSDMFQAKRPCRAPSPPNVLHSAFVVPPPLSSRYRHNSTGSMHAPPQTRRSPSPTEARFDFAPPQLQRHASMDSVFSLPPTRPARVPSPTNVFPEPARRPPLNSNMFPQCPTPHRPGR
jgi:hypothetical protein